MYLHASKRGSRKDWMLDCIMAHRSTRKWWSQTAETIPRSVLENGWLTPGLSTQLYELIANGRVSVQPRSHREKKYTYNIYNLQKCVDEKIYGT